MKKKLFFIIVLAFLGLSVNAQWVWAKNSTGPGETWGNNVCVDSHGNSYVTGDVNLAISIGTSVIDTGIYVVKYDPTGNIIWVKSIGGSGDGRGFVDKNDNYYVTGDFSHSMGPVLIFGNDTLVAPGNPDIFVAKFDPSGNALWGRKSNTTCAMGGSISSSIAVDIYGNVFISGYFLICPPTFDSITVSYGLSSSGMAINGFLTKYDSLGNVLWVVSGISTGVTGTGIGTDALGNVYASVGYNDTVIVDGSIFINPNSTGNDNFLVFKFSPLGKMIWSKNFGGPGGGYCYGVTADLDGNVYFTGCTYNPPITFGAYTLSSSGQYFLVKADSSGNVLWAKDCFGFAVGKNIATSVDGDVFVVGDFKNDNWYPFSLDSIVLLCPGPVQRQVFVAKYDASGNILWAVNSVGDGGDLSYAIAVDANESVFVTGAVADSIAFGSTILFNPSNGFEYDMFIAKLSSTTGVLEQIDENSSAVFPNPSSGKFTFSSEVNEGEIFVYSIVGEKILSQKINSGKTELDLSRQSNGVYFIHLISQKGTVIKKISVSK